MANTKTSSTKTKQNTNKGFNQDKMNKLTLILSVIVLLIILLIFYFYRWNDVRNAERIRSSYLLTSETVSLEIKNVEEVRQILSEAPTEYFVLISYTKNNDTYTLEKGLKPLIDDYALSDRFYYLDATAIMGENDYLERLNNAFDTNKITKVPTILYYRDGKLAEVVERDDNNPINAGDFQKLLDIYEIEKAQ